jgi:predicted SAM-dependent methyltransferase
MFFQKSASADRVVARLLKRLPKGIKDKLIELAGTVSERAFRHFPALKQVIAVRAAPDVPVLGIRERVASEYLQGSGIEIGALHAPLKLPDGTRVQYVDKYPTDFLRAQHPELSEHEFAEVDIVDDGERLGKIADESQDFVIANHFVEHCQDPIRAVGHMVRVLREDGCLYISLPDKRYTFDRDRPLTSIEHILSDYRCGPDGSRRHHLEEWFRLVEKIEDEAQRQHAVDEFLQSEGHIHYHVWNQKEMLELIATLQGFYDLELEAVCRHGIEVIFVLRKQKVSS